MNYRHFTRSLRLIQSPPFFVSIVHGCERTRVIDTAASENTRTAQEVFGLRSTLVRREPILTYQWEFSPLFSRFLGFMTKNVQPQVPFSPVQLANRGSVHSLSIGSLGGHEGRFSRDPLPVFFPYGRLSTIDEDQIKVSTKALPED